MDKNQIRVALLCSGLGRIKRGFESFTEELFLVLKDYFKITLFKGGGQAKESEVVIRCIKREGVIRFVPFSLRTRLFLEAYTFVLFFLPYLFREKFQVIIVSEQASANFLSLIKKLFRLSFSVIICNGGPVPARELSTIDFIIQVTEPEYKKARDYGIAQEKMALLPYGIFVDRFNDTEGKKLLRQHYHIPEKAFVLLSVGQINKFHKRMDFLIRVFSKLNPEEFFLLIVGNVDLETEEIKMMARSCLRNNYQFFEDVDYGLISQFYGLSDCLIHCSLIEGFGRVFLEAMSARLPIIAHAMDVSRWVINNEDCLVDMQNEDEVLGRIKRIHEDRAFAQRIVEKNFENVTRRFEWSVIKDQYLKVINHCASQSL